MSDIRDRLREAMEAERRPARKRPGHGGDVREEPAFRPVIEAAEELREELSATPHLEFGIEADGVWVELYDRHLWFGYDPATGRYLGRELRTLWMEGGTKEETFQWDTAEVCIDEMVRACARYATMARTIARFATR